MPLRKKKADEVLEAALFAFWGEVAKAFPQATTGDIDTLPDMLLRNAGKRALANWVDRNIPDAHLHFDYDLQVWVRFGLVQDCGHPEKMTVREGKTTKYCCNQRHYADWPIAKALDDYYKRRNTNSKQGSIIP